MAEIYSIPDGGSSTPQFTIPIGGFNGGGMFGNGQMNLMDLLGFAIVASIFPNIFGNGYGGFGGGYGAGQAGFLSNQISNDSGRELIMQAIANQGESSRTAISTLSTMLGQDFNLVNGAIQNVQSTLAAIGANQGLNALQVINAIQSGNAGLAAQLQQCCCQNQLSTCQQTNTLQNAINGVGTQVQAKAAADQLAMCQQTYALNDTMNRNFLALDNKIDALESNRKDREITALTAEVASLKSQNFTTGVVQQAVAPVIGQISSLAREVDDIKTKMPNTVSVQYPNLQVYNATPYIGGFYGNGFGNQIVF